MQLSFISFVFMVCTTSYNSAGVNLASFSPSVIRKILLRYFLVPTNLHNMSNPTIKPSSISPFSCCSDYGSIFCISLKNSKSIGPRDRSTMTFLYSSLPIVSFKWFPVSDEPNNTSPKSCLGLCNSFYSKSIRILSFAVFIL